MNPRRMNRFMADPLERVASYLIIDLERNYATVLLMFIDKVAVSDIQLSNGSKTIWADSLEPITAIGVSRVSVPGLLD